MVQKGGDEMIKPRFIDANKLRDVFWWGIDDKSILSSTDEDWKVVKIIDEQPTLNPDILVDANESSLEDLKHKMCDRYCKYMDEDMSEEEYNELLDTTCSECPLGLLKGRDD